jgi:xanthine dehydrogenase accessory factor
LPAKYIDDVLPSLALWRAEGLKTALVTMVGADGSAPRPIGSQMGVCEDGRAVGNLTGGCAEAAIIAEAQAAMAAGANRCVRYGAGSPYIDIRLPCGSGIDVYFDVTLADADLETLLTAKARRRQVALCIDAHADRRWIADAAPQPAPGLYARAITPMPRLVVVGKGPIVALLARMARAVEFEVLVWSSERETLDDVADSANEASHLAAPEAFAFDGFDRWTAFVSLFHEHEWEPPLLARALAAPCFYVGALGSRRTHATRLEVMRARGMSDEVLARIHAPVGLAIGAKTPPEIAVAILAQIIQVRRLGTG